MCWSAARPRYMLLAPCCCAANLCDELERCRSGGSLPPWPGGAANGGADFCFPNIFYFNPAPPLPHRGSKAHAQANSCRQGSRRRAHRQAAMSDGGKMAPSNMRRRRAPPPGQIAPNARVVSQQFRQGSRCRAHGRRRCKAAKRQIVSILFYSIYLSILSRRAPP